MRQLMVLNIKVLVILWGWCLCYSAVKRQKAVSAYSTSEHILPFGFARQYTSEQGQICGVF